MRAELVRGVKLKEQRSYRELNIAQRNCADSLTYLLGTCLDDKVFKITSDSTVSAVCNLLRRQPYTSDWGSFCYDHRRSFSRGDHCCDGINIYPVRNAEEVLRLDSLSTLKQLLEQESNAT